MKGKLLFVTGLSIGYVLGARAGRKRYEQIAGAARKVWETPGVQKQVHEVQDFAADKVGDIPGALIDAGKKAVASVAAARKDAKRSTSKNGSKGAASKNAGKSSASHSTAVVPASGSSSAAEASAATPGEEAAATASSDKPASGSGSRSKGSARNGK